jgi:hypothetical protein
MKIGFSGTRDGMTVRQCQAFRSLLASLKPTQFGYGDCIGSDDEAAVIIYENALSWVGGGIHSICYPPIDSSLRAYNPCHDEIREPKTHFARNRDIVNDCDVLVATPREMEHQKRGGTWYTVDYARKHGKLTYVIYPDGHIEVSPLTH